MNFYETCILLFKVIGGAIIALAVAYILSRVISLGVMRSIEQYKLRSLAQYNKSRFNLTKKESE